MFGSIRRLVTGDRHEIAAEVLHPLMPEYVQCTYCAVTDGTLIQILRHLEQYTGNLHSIHTEM